MAGAPEYVAVAIDVTEVDVIMLRTGTVVDQGSPAELVGRYGRDTMEEVFLDIARGRRRTERTNANVEVG